MGEERSAAKIPKNQDWHPCEDCSNNGHRQHGTGQQPGFLEHNAPAVEDSARDVIYYNGRAYKWIPEAVPVGGGEDGMQSWRLTTGSVFCLAPAGKCGANAGSRR